MRKIFLLIAFFSALMANAIEKNDERYVVMISLDGYRWDYPEWFDTPFMDRLAAEGVEAGLISCFPSKTFPNHYSIATGLHPDHHGIIHNSFLDRKTGTVFSISNPETKSIAHYWQGEPLWLTAKHNGVKTAVFYWPGSDVAIGGEYPDEYYVYDSDNRVPMDNRVELILKAMNRPAKKRPHLIMGYMEEPDHNGHVYSPQSKKCREAVLHVDSLLSILYDGIQKLPYADKVDFIVVADHGMALVTPERRIPVMDKLNPDWIERIEGNLPANIYAKEGCADLIYNALKDTPHLQVWRKGQVPEMLHYGTNELCGDIIASPDLGYIFTDGKVNTGGQHGFDPNYNDMHALFRAVGPDFKHIRTEHFSNTNIYPLVCHLLGITPAHNDGDINNVKHILK